MLSKYGISKPRVSSSRVCINRFYHRCTRHIYFKMVEPYIGYPWSGQIHHRQAIHSWRSNVRFRVFDLESWQHLLWYPDALEGCSWVASCFFARRYVIQWKLYPCLIIFFSNCSGHSWWHIFTVSVSVFRLLAGNNLLQGAGTYYMFSGIQCKSHICCLPEQ